MKSFFNWLMARLSEGSTWAGIAAAAGAASVALQSNHGLWAAAAAAFAALMIPDKGSDS